MKYVCGIQVRSSGIYTRHLTYRKHVFCRIMNNSAWYEQMNLVDFLATTGRHFRVGSMLARTR